MRQERRPSIRQIVEALNAGQPEAALGACLALLGQAGASGDPALNQLAATAALRTGRAGEAEVFARRSLAGRPDHVPTLILAGRALRLLGRAAEALAPLERAAALAPALAEPAFLVLGARLEAGEPPETLGLGHWAALFPGEVTGWEEAAEVLAKVARPDAALFCLEAASRARPGFTLAMRRGLLARELGRGERALAAFAEATTRDPASARAWFLLGVTAQDLGDRATAAAAYGRALDADPGLAEAAVNLGTLLQAGRDLEGARAAYARAVGIRPDTFGRIAQAMTSSPKGELWLDLAALQGDFASLARALGPKGAPVDPRRAQ